jgi:acyl-CoA synthetase (AMP-forming)/AMP-acid ligase II
MARTSEKIVRENHNGVQILNYMKRPASLQSILEDAVAKAPEKNIFECHSETVTYEQFFDYVDRVAAAMQKTLGVEKGDRIAFLLGNDLPFPLTFLAAARIGAVSVPINTRFVSSEIAHILKNSGASVVVVDTHYWNEFSRARESVDGIKHVVLTAPLEAASECFLLEDFMKQSSEKTEVRAVNENDVVSIFYTAGTMGEPRGAVCTQRNFISSAMNTRRAAGGNPDSRALICVPLCHPMACHSQMIYAIYNGSTAVIQRYFNADETLRLIGTKRITTIVGVPTIYWLLLAQMNLKHYDLSSLKNVIYGGAPASPELIRRLREVLPSARLGNGYGLTETSALATFLPDEYAMKKPDSVGPPVPTVEIRIVDESGKNLVPGKIGEILVKGPNVVDGYWQDDQATEETFVDGWFLTGDLGRVDNEGFLYIVDRKKDMIIRGGENIYCVEIENVLESHPGVFQAAVVGEPDKVFGEQVMAYIVPNPGYSLTVDEMLDFCDDNLADFKVPKYINFVDALPRTPAGKVDKTVLRR